MRRLFPFVFILSITSFYNVRAQLIARQPDYGLEFSSYEVKTDHRTGLSLKKGEAYNFNGDFKVSFDLAFRRIHNAYGYILRIIANDSTNLDLMAVPEDDDFGDLNLVINNEPTPLRFDFTDENLKPLQWTNVSIQYSASGGEITLRWNQREKKYKHDLTGLSAFRFLFGVNEFGKFSTTDAPPIVVKNISLEDGSQLINKWLVKEHAVNSVYDSIDRDVALVKNPRWLIDRHIKWTHLKNFTLQKYPSIAFNGDSAILYAIDEKSLTVYDLNTQTIVRTPNKNGNPVNTEANQLLYVKQTGSLVNYDVLSNRLNPYNFTTSSWANRDTTHFEVDYWHNNKFFSPIDSSFYTFGGYGHFKYKNALYKFDAAKDQWTKVETKGSIAPRYLGASGTKSNNEVLFFGGYGSNSGKQELSPQAYYDLYSYNPATREFKKLGDYEPPVAGEDMVFSNSLLIDEGEKCFYVLSYSKSKYQNVVQLTRYFFDQPKPTVFQDSIPFTFHDEDSFCDLFYSAKSNELIAVTAHKDKQLFDVNIYSIGYPPMPGEAVIQDEPGNALSKVLLFGIGGIVVAGVGYVAYRRKRKAVNTQTSHGNPLPAVPQTLLQDTNHEQQMHIGDVVRVPEEHPASSIILFGGFHMYDASGQDIALKFTSTLKELFLLILLHSINDHSISGSLVQELIWPDKDDIAARNNRNVNLKKLRDLLTGMPGVTIENNNSFLRVVLDDSIFCDYLVVSRLLNSNDPGQIKERDRIDLIIKQVHRGSLLQDMQFNALDNYKSDFSNRLIDTLIEFAQRLNPDTDDKILIDIADCTFSHDPLNQEALVIKCNVLNKRGKYSLAKRSYDVFVKVYRNLYAENYPRSFEDIISQTSRLEG
ncbi:kelch repeat-containing protein [Chryseolinea sp. T2]|uniref:kelch repeat-containing protein n=1 Tax=Chryseolinea sp. T2 TaxID=3129255 RepID=UPI00307892D0